MYCPKCKSRLYPQDVEYMTAAGVCSYCVTNDTTPDKRFRLAYQDAQKRKNVTSTRKVHHGLRDA